MARWRKLKGRYYVYGRLDPSNPRKEKCFKCGRYATGSGGKNAMMLKVSTMEALAKNHQIDPLITLWECCDIYYKDPRDRKPNSFRSILEAIRNLKEHFSKNLAIRDVTEKMIKDFLAWMLNKEWTNPMKRSIVKKYTRNGIIRKMRTVRGIFRMMKNEKVIDVNPTIIPIKEFGGPTPVARFLDDPEVSILLFHAEFQKKRGGGYYRMNHGKPYPLRKAIHISLQTGLRASDVLNLESTDLFYSNDGARLKISKKPHMRATKPREDFEIPCPESILHYFQEMEGPLFPEAWDGAYLDCVFRKTAIRAGLYIVGKKRLRFQDMRHTFAKNYLQRVDRASLASLAELLHHKSVEVTRKWYGGFEKKFLKEQVDQIVYKIDAGPPLLKVV